MIQIPPNTLNPFRLPSVLVTEIQKLPQVSCVYFVLGEKEVYYVGISE